MSSITVRNLDESLKNLLRIRAAHHGWSMEQEVRVILQQTLATPPADQINFADRINTRFVAFNVDTLPTPARQAARTPSDFNTP